MFEYVVRVCVNGWLIDGSFTVTAENYDEAFKKAYRACCSAEIKLPGTLNLNITDEDVEIVSTNAGKIFEKELQKALTKYPANNIDIIYDETLYQYCIMYHSNNNSFNIFGIDGDEFIFEDDLAIEDALTQMADKYHVGHCF